MPAFAIAAKPLLSEVLEHPAVGGEGVVGHAEAAGGADLVDVEVDYGAGAGDGEDGRVVGEVLGGRVAAGVGVGIQGAVVVGPTGAGCGGCASQLGGYDGIELGCAYFEHATAAEEAEDARGAGEGGEHDCEAAVAGLVEVGDCLVAAARQIVVCSRGQSPFRTTLANS